MSLLDDRHRRVGFVDEPNHVIPPRFSVLTESPLNDMWYSREDFKRFRSNSQTLASRIRHKQSDDPNPSYTTTLASTYASCCRGHEPDKGDLGSLATWFSIGAGRRGLEYQSLNKSERLGRKLRNSIAIANVLKAQAMESADSDAKAEFVRKVCEQNGNPARLFAIGLAEASELSSRDDMNADRNLTLEEQTVTQRLPQHHGCFSRNQKLQKSTSALYHRYTLPHTSPHQANHHQLRRSST